MKKLKRYSILATLLFLVSFLCSGAEAGLDDGLVAWWKFDDGSGTTVEDSVGSNNGTLTNGLIWTDGQINGALTGVPGLKNYGKLHQQTLHFLRFVLLYREMMRA